ncbi:hypothetical protein BBBOND_0209710 [Babesia bigemina]|uniref:Uncharacterized protein n=1 Tax=Babesia bigemina TaxID=5866 RepID=A0A061D5K4_BABBI|nr:hypothetical protein BBBOND_0209710 [Babesia bigemina]CDR95818.1 hypothetical protein BBBOND_0209710 [Babesia bigemina]|eukprot:XP_012768004.1 hypothetical protein BBBOND_0209710 [Babesia bigemina]
MKQSTFLIQHNGPRKNLYNTMRSIINTPPIIYQQPFLHFPLPLVHNGHHCGSIKSKELPISITTAQM